MDLAATFFVFALLPPQVLEDPGDADPHLREAAALFSAELVRAIEARGHQAKTAGRAEDFRAVLIVPAARVEELLRETGARAVVMVSIAAGEKDTVRLAAAIAGTGERAKQMVFEGERSRGKLKDAAIEIAQRLELIPVQEISRAPFASSPQEKARTVNVAPVVVATTALNPPATREPETRNVPARVLAISGGAVAVAGLAGGAISYFGYSSNIGSGRFRDRREVDDLIAGGRSTALVADLALAAGCTALATATLLWLTGIGESEVEEKEVLE